MPPSSFPLPSFGAGVLARFPGVGRAGGGRSLGSILGRLVAPVLEADDVGLRFEVALVAIFVLVGIQ